MKRLTDDPTPLTEDEAFAAKLARTLRAQTPPAFAEARVRARLDAPRRPVLARVRPAAWVVGVACACAATFAIVSSRHEAPRQVAPQVDAAMAPRAPEPVVAPVEAAAAQDAAVPPTKRVASPKSRVAEPAGDDEESLLLARAYQSLRRRHDAAAALAAVADYLSLYPRGALTEEALGLAVEACADVHVEKCERYAAEYLAAYPQGRFADAARTIATSIR